MYRVPLQKVRAGEEVLVQEVQEGKMHRRITTFVLVFLLWLISLTLCFGMAYEMGWEAGLDHNIPCPTQNQSTSLL